jgi:diaminohydroxyphosphoribosylaminopyrimidine deaminase / 5-amino-6-(5-phosphoribosylamino)uracil reductase
MEGQHEKYMARCLQLAQLGEGFVSPNPMVGALLVYNDMIIGEGYHRKYGEAHAEVNCINSVSLEQKDLIKHSTLYVSLEPCAHFGKTPPCADLIVKMGILKVVIGCRDPFVQVDGKGIEKLQVAGVEVITGVLERECKELNKRFFTFHMYKRPYIILKWAQTADGKIAYNTLKEKNNPSASRLFITNIFTNRIVHKWRSEEMAILVGTNTALQDNPSLSTRLWPGKDPVRMVVDIELALPDGLKLFDGSIPTIVFNKRKHSIEDLKAARQTSGLHYYQVKDDSNLVQQIISALYSMDIQSLIVEGGSVLLQSFIEEDLWDEAKIITNEEMILGEGLLGPVLRNEELVHSEQLSTDVIRTYHHIEMNEPL